MQRILRGTGGLYRLVVHTLRNDAIPFGRPKAIPEPFWSARRRLDRADKHIVDLESAIAAYLEGQPFVEFTEINESRTHEFHKLGFFVPVPDTIADCAFDAASNLRAALDSAAYAIASAHAPARANMAHFPIADTEAGVADLFNKKYRGAFPLWIKDTLRQLQPYEGGRSHLVWALNRIRRQAEHRLLVRCEAKADFRLISSSISPGSEFQFFEYVESSEDDRVFAICPIGSEFEFEANVTINIAFGDGVDAAAGQPVVQFLKMIREQVHGAVDAFEAEARRTGLI